MTNYRRNFLPGASYFFTVNLADRRLRLLAEKGERGATSAPSALHSDLILRSDAKHRVSKDGQTVWPWFETPRYARLLTMRFVSEGASSCASERGARGHLAAALLGAHVA